MSVHESCDPWSCNLPDFVPYHGLTVTSPFAPKGLFDSSVCLICVGLFLVVRLGATQHSSSISPRCARVCHRMNVSRQVSVNLHEKQNEIEHCHPDHVFVLLPFSNRTLLDFRWRLPFKLLVQALRRCSCSSFTTSSAFGASHSRCRQCFIC